MSITVLNALKSDQTVLTPAVASVLRRMRYADDFQSILPSSVEYHGQRTDEWL